MVKVLGITPEILNEMRLKIVIDAHDSVTTFYDVTEVDRREGCISFISAPAGVVVIPLQTVRSACVAVMTVSDCLLSNQSIAVATSLVEAQRAYTEREHTNG